MMNEKVSPYKKGDIDMHQMRRAKPAEFWETHIKKWKAATNEPKSEYCKRHGLLETQFTYWINRLLSVKIPGKQDVPYPLQKLTPL